MSRHIVFDRMIRHDLWTQTVSIDHLRKHLYAWNKKYGVTHCEYDDTDGIFHVTFGREEDLTLFLLTWNNDTLPTPKIYNGE